VTLPDPLWISRKGAARMLGGISPTTIKRHEARLGLHPKTIGIGPTAQIFYDINEIRAIAATGLPLPAEGE
jgi:hypothetical protein